MIKYGPSNSKMVGWLAVCVWSIAFEEGSMLRMKVYCLHMDSGWRIPPPDDVKLRNERSINIHLSMLDGYDTWPD